MVGQAGDRQGTGPGVSYVKMKGICAKSHRKFLKVGRKWGVRV